jgi:hypothetical protein
MTPVFTQLFPLAALCLLALLAVAWASDVTHTTATRQAIGDSVCNSSTGQLGNNFQTKLYTGTVLSGTVSVTGGGSSNSVSGSGTSFTTALAVGQSVVFASDPALAHYKVATISSNTALTLTANYVGTTLSGSALWSSPPSAQSSLSGNTAAATVTSCAYGANSGGVSTLTASTNDSSAAGGTVIFGRQLTSGGTPVLQFEITPTSTGGTSMTMNTPVISAGAVVGFSGTNTYTAPQ